MHSPNVPTNENETAQLTMPTTNPANSIKTSNEPKNVTNGKQPKHLSNQTKNQQR
jgi:hypothetical protein